MLDSHNERRQPSCSVGKRGRERIFQLCVCVDVEINIFLDSREFCERGLRMCDGNWLDVAFNEVLAKVCKKRVKTRNGL